MPWSLPVALLVFHRWHSQELIDGFVRIIHLQLLGIVVFVLNADIASLLIIAIFILKVVPVRVSMVLKIGVLGTMLTLLQTLA